MLLTVSMKPYALPVCDVDDLFSIGVFLCRVVRNLYINIQSICIIRQKCFLSVVLLTESLDLLSSMFVSDLKNDFVFKAFFSSSPESYC